MPPSAYPVIARGPSIIYTPNSANHVKNDDFLFQKRYILLFAVFGSRSIIRGDFWGLAMISHLAYNSKNKKDDFSWFLISKKLYNFAHFCSILGE